ncbi:MAG: cation:dicarboxylase symporter family transporter, partial [Raoultibacter sp.]
MKQILQKWNNISLIKRIVVGLVIGAVVGIFFPHLEVFTLLGTLFVSALKAVAPILVFFLVISALANAKSAGSMSGVILLYMLSTLVAAL